MSKNKLCEIEKWQKIKNDSGGKLLLVQENRAIIRVQAGENLSAASTTQNSLCKDDNPTPLLDSACRQLREYLTGRRKNFTLPLQPHGTSFQLKVWQELQKIPYGETRSYKQIAENIAAGSPRAVGGACGQNPILIFIPCHRVIRSDGAPGGFGAGKKVKKQLLKLEGCKI